MLSRKLLRKLTALLIVVAVWSIYSMAVLAAPTDVNGVITVIGSVTVNGQPAISDATIVSGSRIETAANSTAIISISKVGKVELAPETSLTLRFTESSLIGILDAGKVTVFNNAGVATTFTTKNATIIADTGQANNFVVEVECSHTHVDTISGLVTMRTGTTDKQVAAGTDAFAGDMQQPGCKPCLRPGPVIPIPVASGIGAGAIAAILLGIGGAVITGIIVGTGGENPTTGGSTTVVSPTS